MNEMNKPARVEPLYCPLCGRIRRKPTDLVDGDCFREYTNDAAVGLARGNYQSLLEWVKAKAPAILESLEPQHEDAVRAVENLKTEVHEKTLAELRKSTGGKPVLREVWSKAYREKKKETWKNLGGNAKFAKMKGLEGRIKLLKQILSEPEPNSNEASLELPESPEEGVSPKSESGPKNPKSIPRQKKGGKNGRKNKLNEAKDKEAEKQIAEEMTS